MRQWQKEIDIETGGAGLYDITDRVTGVVNSAAVETGLAHLFCRHTSASLLIQENADPDVQRDLVAFFKRLVPDGDPLFIHRSEGPDDMPAHVKSALMQTTLTIPITRGRMALGTWQGIYLFEHRTAPHRRRLIVHVAGT